MLYDPRAHEPLVEAAWAPDAIAAEILAIARDAEDGLARAEWWPVHPLDAEDGDPAVWHGLYLGAAGVLWALDSLARAGLYEPRLDHARGAAEGLESHGRRPEFEGERGLWIGEGGIALLAWRLAPTPALADRLAALLAVPEDDTLELMWGSPGLLLIADALLERTGDQRWADAWHALANHLLRRWGEQVSGFWTQRVYGSTGEHIGPAHGMAGIVAALARRLPPNEIAPRATQALAATAVRDGPHANWPAMLDEGLVHRTGTIRTQWCHGAPGVVASLASLPREDELDALLLAGGELTWAAGPLRKGANLCHGTAGNGYAFLKLFARTGDELWLERARRFAMHAMGQVAAARRDYAQGRHSLWTGDVGTAIYLDHCLTGDAEMPGLDAW